MARKIEVEIVGDSASVERAFRRAGGAADTFGSKIGRTSKIAIAAFSALAAGGLVKVVKAAADFQQSLNVFQAVSQASGEQMKKVSALAKQLGADVTLPATSAKDAADAMVEMSKAGISVKNTMSAAKGVLLLSAAAETDNAYAARVAANTLNAFSLGGKAATEVADLLAAASVAASGEITDMADSLQYVSATAAQSHQSLAGTVTAIGEMANKGIIGSQSGAALQQMLLRLQAPTKKATDALKDLGVSVYDQHGKMQSLRTLIGQFSKATEGMSDKQRNAAMNSIFGARAIRAANIVLLGGVDAYDKMAKAVGRSGAAQDLAKAKMKGFNGSVQALKSAVETLEITLGTPLLNAVTKAAYALANITNHIDTVAGGKGSIASKLQTLFGDAIGAVNWTVVWSRAETMGEGLKQRFDSIDWSATGSAIGDGISRSVEGALRASKGIPSAFESSFRSIDWVKLGRAMGPGIVAAVASAIAAALDPVFWIKNWDLALAIAAAVFTKGLGKIAGKLAAPLARVMGDAVLVAAAAIERLSPRLASAFLAVMLRLPALAGRALGALESLVGRAFGRLGGLAKFTLKVLGIQAAIDAIASFATAVWGWIQKVVNWFKELPGRIIGAIGNVDLSAIGRRMVQGIIDGMKSKLGDLLGAAGGIVGAAKKRLEFWHSPPEAYGKYIGGGIAGGIAAGLTAGTGRVVASAGNLIASAKAKMDAALRDVNRLQAQIDATARAREDRDNRKALADAQKQLADARKKGKGIVDAEQAVADALDRIRDTARQRDLDKTQANYDKLQKAYDAATAKLEKAQQKAADHLQKMQDRAGTAFDRLAAKIQTAFGAKNDAWVAPAQQAINAIMDRRAQEDLQTAADDAQKAYEDALLGGDVADIARKLRDRDRALEDIRVAALEKDAATQATAHQQMVDAQQEALDTALEGLRTSLTEQGMTWDKGLTAVLGIISTYVGPFSEVGRLLGDAFAKSLAAAATGAADAGAAVAAASGKGGSSSWVNGTSLTGPYIGTLPGNGTTKVYNLNVGKIEEVKPNETATYFRMMERLGA